jgi:hypothetical protein
MRSCGMLRSVDWLRHVGQRGVPETCVTTNQRQKDEDLWLLSFWHMRFAKWPLARDRCRSYGQLDPFELRAHMREHSKVQPLVSLVDWSDCIMRLVAGPWSSQRSKRKLRFTSLILDNTLYYPSHMANRVFSSCITTLYIASLSPWPNGPIQFSAFGSSLRKKTSTAIGRSRRPIDKHCCLATRGISISAGQQRHKTLLAC